jgi:urea transporter
MNGLLILVGLIVQSPAAALHGVIGLVCGNLVAAMLGFDKGLARSGFFGCNAFLFESSAMAISFTSLATISSSSSSQR